MARPAEETPTKSIWLSSLDLTVLGPHICTLYVYHPENSNNTNNCNFLDATILKESLRRALVPFYPMAGRLKEADHNGRLEIDCNGEGALFVEAETMHSLVDFGDFKPSPELTRLVIPTCDYSKGHALIPLLMVQLTRFRCGGVTLGFAQHHRVADGLGHLHFIKSWARLARGLDLEVAPLHERNPHLVPRNPTQVKSCSNTLSMIHLKDPQVSTHSIPWLSLRLSSISMTIWAF